MAKWLFLTLPVKGFVPSLTSCVVCNPRASVCHGTGGCLCPRTIRAQLNQGETSPQHRQLFCGNNKTKGSAGTGCPLNWRSGGCCFQQSTCVFISVSFACVCLSFLISRRPDPDYIYRRVLLNWSRRWPILLTLQTIYQHLSFSPETEDTYQAHQRVKGGRAAGVVCRGDNNSSSPSLCTTVGWDGAGHDLASPADLLHPTDYPAAQHRCSPTADHMISPGINALQLLKSHMQPKSPHGYKVSRFPMLWDQNQEQYWVRERQ